MPLLIDTDIGTNVDDAIALALAARSPALDLRAVTTVTGDTALRADVATHILQLCERPDVRVGAGTAPSLSNGVAPRWFGHEGTGLPSRSAPPEYPSAMDIYRDLAAPESAQIIALGPLTNVAGFVAQTTVSNIRALTIMGGSLGLRRGGRPVPIDYNLSCDPHASARVLQTNVPITIVPLDATWGVTLRKKHVSHLREHAGELGSGLADLIDIWSRVQRERFAKQRTFETDECCSLHDAIAVANLIEPEMFEMQEMKLGAEPGRCGLALRHDGSVPALRVVTHVDRDKFVDWLLAQLGA